MDKFGSEVECESAGFDPSLYETNCKFGRRLSRKRLDILGGRP